jgi:DNA-binding NarL/FixJ family response regulator
MPNLRILVGDDHEIVRCGLCAIIQRYPGWEVCGEACDGAQVVELAKLHNPDIILMDISMPRLSGLEAARQILQSNPQARILFLTVFDSDQVAQEALQVGGKGYMLKTDASRDLVSAIQALQSNRTFFTARVSDLVLGGFLLANPTAAQHGPRIPALTPRELDIVRLVAQGKSTNSIAEALHISSKTADTHRANIMRKLKFHSTTDLVLYAIKNNLISNVAPDQLPRSTGPSQVS